ncbi:AbrB family transcriptional regulator [Labrenzia sp. OB1]|uniref:AbrB family transcriptional regulator n=1 Tax=Labrenzia sp. OB1 TaxID=1561204 RepID=UPI0007B178A6|nr:AbrB family transcriptional regulator [Labrenzia sp. OB1]KZM49556.1 hypothetical protein OA90_13810 [Labrenzia sp. OB1]
MIDARAILAAAVTVTAAIAAAILFEYLRLPLPWMLGPLLVTAAASFLKVKILGFNAGLPAKSRTIFVPIVGLMIGSSISGDFASELARWWPSLLLVAPYACLVQIVNAAILRRVGGYDPATAFFAASPGGLVEAVLIGEQNGGKASLMTIQHFARVSLSVSVIPILLSFYYGEPVGSAAGIVADSGGPPLTVQDAALLAAAGILGVFLGRRLRLPAAIMVGPFLLSAVLHGTGVTAAQIPQELLKMAQLVIGITIGMRFAGPSRTELARGLGLSVLTLSTTLAVAFLMALLVSGLGMAATVAGFIAFAPGGLVEMGLIAISIGADPVFVATHHVLRIGFAVTLAPLLFHALYGRAKKNARQPDE